MEHSVTLPRRSPPTRDGTVLGRLPPRAVLAVVAGLVVGCLTSLGQSFLDGALNAFVNSASAWLVAPFVVGTLMTSRRGAMVAGLTTCALQLVGYYVTADLRGYSAGGGIVVFWAACAVVGGPLFAAAGHVWRTAAPRRRGLGGAVPAAMFLAEGLWVYLYTLHYYESAALWLAIGVVLAAVLARGVADLRWLALTLPCGLAGEIVLAALYRQSF